MTNEATAIDKLRARDAELADHRKQLPDRESAPVRLNPFARFIPSPEDEAAARLAAESWRESQRRQREEHEAAQAPLRDALKTEQAATAFGRCPPAIAKFVDGDGFNLSLSTVAVSRRWAKGERRGLILRGGVGTGKSVAAACALAEYSQRHGHGFDVSWHRPNDFVSGVIHAYDAKAPKIAKGMIVIDDLGRETKADFEEALVILIDDTLTRFVITTNLTREEMVARYGERLIDRLDHECLTVATAGKSMRGGQK